MPTEIRVFVNDDYIPEEGDHFDAVVAALEQFDISAGVCMGTSREDEALREQAIRAVFEGEQTHPGIASRPELKALRDLLGLGDDQ